MASFFSDWLIYNLHDTFSPLFSFLQTRKFWIPRSCPSYPEQRHRFPARYSFISSSFGNSFSRNNASAFIIMPGLQKPHCSAPWSAMNAPNSSASSLSPSSVVTLCLSTLAARIEQDSTGLSSKNTVQSPQPEVSHPRFTLLHPCFLTKSIRSRSGSISS